jgi:hypothetical protein
MMTNVNFVHQFVRTHPAQSSLIRQHALYYIYLEIQIVCRGDVKMLITKEKTVHYLQVKIITYVLYLGTHLSIIFVFNVKCG